MIYALDPRDRSKQDVARGLLSGDRIRVSPQVALEASNNLVRKFGYEKHEIGPALDFLLPLIHPVHAETIERAWGLMSRYGFKIWDAAIVAAALSAGCAVLYTEDLQHDQTIEGVRIVNPFL